MDNQVKWITMNQKGLKRHYQYSFSYRPNLQKIQCLICVIVLAYDCPNGKKLAWKKNVNFNHVEKGLYFKLAQNQIWRKNKNDKTPFASIEKKKSSPSNG